MGQYYVRYTLDGEVAGFYNVDTTPIESGEPRILFINQSEYEAGMFTKYVVKNNSLVIDWSPEADLEKVRIDKIHEINASAAHAYDSTQYVLYAHFERGTWARQQIECERWFSSAPLNRVPDVVPWCAICAEERGVALASFMDIVKERMERYYYASAKISGKRQRLTEDIYACEDSEEGIAALRLIKWGDDTDLGLLNDTARITVHHDSVAPTQ